MAASEGQAPAARRPLEGVAALLDILPVGVVVLDRDMRVREMNPAAARLVGWKEGAARGAHCRDVMRCVLCDDDCVARRAASTGRTHMGGFVCLRPKAGGSQPTRLDAVALDDASFALAMRPEGEADAPLATHVSVPCADQDERIRAALRRSAGSVTVAARLLGVHRTTMWRWMAERGLSRREFRPQ